LLRRYLYFDCNVLPILGGVIILLLFSPLMIVFELYILFVAHSLLVSESTSVTLLCLAQDVHHRVSLTTYPVQL
jgi:hypothetical protein